MSNGYEEREREPIEQNPLVRQALAWEAATKAVHKPKVEVEDLGNGNATQTITIEFEWTAADLLKQAAATQQQRAVDYDKPGGERSVRAIVGAFNAITGRNLTETEGWLILLLLKAVRAFTNPKNAADSCVDMVSYAALLGECMLAKEG